MSTILKLPPEKACDPDKPCVDGATCVTFSDSTSGCVCALGMDKDYVSCDGGKWTCQNWNISLYIKHDTYDVFRQPTEAIVIV